MKPENKAVENIFFISLSWLITTLGGFLFWLIAGKFLNQEEYGIALTAVSAGFFIISFITLGIPAALSKLIPEYKSKNDYKKIKSIITASILIITTTTLLISSILIIFKDSVSKIIKLKESIYYLIIVYIVIGALGTTFYTITYSFQEMKKYFFVGSASVIIKILTALLVLFLGFKYFGPIIGTIISSAFTLILCFPKKYITKKYSVFDEDLYKYAITGFIGAITFSLLSNFHYTIVTILKSSANTGIFGVAMMVSSIIGAIPNILNTAIYPIVSEIFKTKSKKSIPILIENTIKYTLLISIPLIITFSILSKFIVLSFSSYKFIESANLIPTLTVASLFLGLSSIFVNMLFAIRKPRIYIKILSSISLIFLLVTIPLTYFYAEIGMSIGFLITTIIFFIISFWQIRRRIKIKIDLIQILKILLASSSFLILYILKPNNLLAVLSAVIITFLIYIFLLYILNFFNKNDKKILQYFLSKIFNRK